MFQMGVRQRVSSGSDEQKWGPRHGRSVPIDTSIPIKPSGQKESRRTSFLRCVRVGVPWMMVRATSNTDWTVTPLGRMEVLETLSSRPVFSLKTNLTSVKT